MFTFVWFIFGLIAGAGFLAYARLRGARHEIWTCANGLLIAALIYVVFALVWGKDVMAGAIDVTTNHIETPEEVAGTIRNALEYVAPEKLFPCTTCGMVPLAKDVARGKLNALAEGAALVRAELN